MTMSHRDLVQMEDRERYERRLLLPSESVGRLRERTVANCQACRFFDWHYYVEIAGHDDHEVPIEGVCRRFPPVRTSNEKTYETSDWTVVRGCDWCGEFVEASVDQRRRVEEGIAKIVSRLEES